MSKPARGGPGTLEAAAALLRAGRIVEAEAELRRIVGSRPADAEALELLGVALGAQGRHAQALEAFDRARTARPTSASIRRNRAQALLQLARPLEAREELEKAVQMRPDHAASWALLGNVLAASGDAGGAERAYRRCLQVAPSAQAHYNLGVLLQQHGRGEEAIGAYRAALSLTPAFAAAHNNLANALSSRGEIEAALAHHAAAARLEPARADFASNYGAALRAAGRAEDAIAWLERALAIAPDVAATLNNLGAAYHERHRDREAVGCYRRAVALAPDLREARNNLGSALVALGELDEAEACYREAIARWPEHPDGYSHLGVLEQERGHPEAAMAFYEQALARDPAHSDAFNNLGYLMQDRGRFAEAIALYERALEANPRSARAAYNLGLALLMGGDFRRGWPLHESRFQTVPPVAIARPMAVPRLEAADLGVAQRIAVWREQGVGDQLLYSTLVPELASLGHAIVLEADPRLHAALRRAHPEWTVVAPEEATKEFTACARHVPLGSIPLLLRPDAPSFARQPRAILAASDERAAGYRARIAAAQGELAVAISWRSFQPRGRGHVERRKSASLEHFLALSARAGVRLVDVQYGDTQAERERFAALGGRLTRFDELDLFSDLDGVLSAIAACDAVLTTSNVTAHLAGALGKETLLVYLAANPPFHYWAPDAQGRSIWYPSVRIVTGAGVGTWDQALAIAGEHLSAMLRR